MKRLLALVLVCSATTAFARPPMLVPQNAGSVNYQAQYSPTPVPVPNSALPPAPGFVPGTTSSVSGTIVYPGQPTLSPVPAGIPAGQIICDACDGGYLPLYNRVRVVQARKIAPCAVSKIVSVPDPCNPCQVVFVEICVPPCACETIECHPRKNRTVFNYGKYAVKVTERHGTLVINYDN